MQKWLGTAVQAVLLGYLWDAGFVLADIPAVIMKQLAKHLQAYNSTAAIITPSRCCQHGWQAFKA
jgi:hypothetical protein